MDALTLLLHATPWRPQPARCAPDRARSETPTAGTVELRCSPRTFPLMHPATARSHPAIRDCPQDLDWSKFQPAACFVAGKLLMRWQKEFEV